MVNRDFNAFYSEHTNQAGSVGRSRPRQIARGAPHYRVASWKNIQFFIDTSSDEFGRRGDVYEYPLSDDIGFVDLGRKARRYKIEGYLIGEDQPDQTTRMVNAAESPYPGILIHPMFGTQSCTCVTLTVAADYRRDKKRTKLSFEFVEAYASGAGTPMGASLQTMFQSGNESVLASSADGSASASQFDPSADTMQLLDDISNALRGFTLYNLEATNAAGLDAADMLQRWGVAPSLQQSWGMRAVREMRAPTQAAGTLSAGSVSYVFPTLRAAIDPIDYASSLIREVHTDALKRYKDFNFYVVNRLERMAMTASVQSLIITTRLIVARDFAITAMKTIYETVKQALDDLDFLMLLYDEEEKLATDRCDDVLVRAIYRSRATAASGILARNIRLPGIITSPVDGLWPSLVVAQKLFADGKRYEQVERYNSTMVSFWMGRTVVAPAR